MMLGLRAYQQQNRLVFLPPPDLFHAYFIHIFKGSSLLFSLENMTLIFLKPQLLAPNTCSYGFGHHPEAKGIHADHQPARLPDIPQLSTWLSNGHFTLTWLKRKGCPHPSSALSSRTSC